jgi:multidrug resistance efflux pump
VASGLFREEAVKSYMNPDARGGLLVVAPPSGALPFAVIAAVLGLAAVFAAATEVQITAKGRGVVRPARASVVVRAPRAGRIDALAIRPGQTVTAGEALGRIGDVPLAAPEAGEIEYVDATFGETVAEGAPLFEIVPSSEPLVAYMAVPAAHRARLSPGKEVRLRLDEYPASEYGVAIARIDRVGGELLSDARASTFLGAAAKEPSFLVTLRLERMPGAARAPFRNGMLFEGDIALEQRRAISLLFPALSER